MKLGIMQPYFFPYIGYWQLLNFVDVYVVYDDVNYIKGGWINRNYILSNKKKLLLTMPLKQASSNKLIKEIEIENDLNKILKTICQSYSKSPYFNCVYPLIEDIISVSERNLALFLLNSIQKISSYIGIKTKILLSSQIEKNNSLKGQDKVLEICAVMGADMYVNALGGTNLYDAAVFKKYNIDLCFLKAIGVEYKQLSGYFEKNLSIIDIFMMNSPDDIANQLLMFDLLI